MRWISRLRPSPAMVIACIALFAALGGAGYAASTIGSGQIKNNSVQGKDIKNGSIAAKDLSKKTRSSLRGKRGPAGQAGPAGPAGQAGQPGAAGAPGTAKAYAAVTTTPSFIAARTKGFSAVTRVATGDYCLTPESGVDVTGSAPAVSVDWTGSTGNNLSAFWRSSGLGCPAGDLEVLTFIFAAGGNNAASDGVAFTVVAP